MSSSLLTKKILKRRNSLPKFSISSIAGDSLGIVSSLYVSLLSSVPSAETRTDLSVCDCLPQETFVKTSYKHCNNSWGYIFHNSLRF